jgi:ubiquinone/menaquinone biosynthesis C-methylase UbiE
MVDAAPAMLDHCQDLSAELMLADLTNLPLPDAEFDIVVSTWALETLDPSSRKAALSELRRVLKPGGLLCYCVCTAPSSKSVWFLT